MPKNYQRKGVQRLLKKQLKSDGVVWKEIKNHDGYMVSKFGKVVSCWERKTEGRNNYEKTNRWHEVGRLTEQGYVKVLFRGGPDVPVHKLVLETFVGPRPKGMECRHLDGNRSNNRLTNLCWGTQKENMADREQHGNNCMVRHSRKEITNALSMIKSGASRHEVARKMGCHPDTFYKWALGYRRSKT